MENQADTDKYYMQIALKEAEMAFEEDEIPVGAVIVMNNEVIAKAHNQTETLQDVTAHAEIIAITTATNNLGAKYLQNATMYVTVEPCVMCTGAIFWSKISRLVIGATDEKYGYLKFEQILNEEALSLMHPKIEVVKDVMSDEAADLMKRFFQKKRII